jgi:hypothetical protein
MRHWVPAGGLLATAILVALGVGSAHSAVSDTITYGPPGGTPVLAAAVKNGAVTFTWTMPAGHVATNLHWSTDKTTNPVDPTGQSEGMEMTCFAAGPSDGVHNCKGGSDLGDAQLAFTTSTIPTGTYYAQVLTYGAKSYYINGNGPFPGHYDAWSNVAQFTVANSHSNPAVTLASKPAAKPKPKAKPKHK